MAFVRPLNGDKPVDTSPFQGSVPSFANGFYLYVACNYKSSWSFVMFGKQLSFPVTTNYNVAVFKTDASTGSPVWNTYWGIDTHTLVANSIKADERTGAVYMVGSGIQASGTARDTCTTLGSSCGLDFFDFATSSRQYSPGCMEDPRGGTAGVLTGVLIGQPWCHFVASLLSQKTGYIIKFSDAVLDSKNNVLSNTPADSSTARPSVIWAKTFPVATAGISDVFFLVCFLDSFLFFQIHSLAISDNHLLAFGSVTGQSSFSFPNLPTTYTTLAQADIISKLTD